MKTTISILSIFLLLLSCVSEKVTTTKVNITIGNRYGASTISGENTRSSKKAYSGYRSTALSYKMALKTDTNIATNK